MSGSTQLSSEVISYLKSHLAVFNETGKKQMLDSLQVCAADKTATESMLDLYAQEINQLLETSVSCENAMHTLPFVIIGSEVELESANKGRKLRIYITENQNKSSARNQASLASCLSPMGKALFLKKTGDSIEVNAPAGTLHYQICSVTLPFS